MQKKCENCGEMFTPKEKFHKLCPKCFNQQHHSGHNSRSKSSVFEKYKSALKDGYFDEEGCMQLDLVAEFPDKIANVFKKTGGVTSTGLRRFYTMSKSIEQKLEGGESFNCLKADLEELKIHAANAVGKATQKKDKDGLNLLKEFIELNVDQAIKSPKSFKKGFLTHFQSVVAYFKYYENI